LLDCDNNTALIKVTPAGPVCHTGADTCFNERNQSSDFLSSLELIINKRKKTPVQESYTSSLFQKGINAIAQKVGEEAIELVIESKDNDDTKFINETSDLLFHYLVLLNAREKSLKDVIVELQQRQAG
jgi:phosphoribosyl-AMP cyclohydrolase / phosphoribosyl-ATP pyrophosphohydrolase